MLIGSEQQSVGLCGADRGEKGPECAEVGEDMRRAGRPGHSGLQAQCLTQTKALFIFSQCLRQSICCWRGGHQVLPIEGMVCQAVDNIPRALVEVLCSPLTTVIIIFQALYVHHPEILTTTLSRSDGKWASPNTPTPIGC